METLGKINFEIGNLLKVTHGDVFHFERVIAVKPEVLTVDISDEVGGEISTQGLCASWHYELIPDFLIARALRNQFELKDIHCICQYDQYGGATHPDCLIHGYAIKKATS